ncbi:MULTISPECIES: DUF1772 domain-containing protein [Arsenicicoccus]|uniref:anthrone oxygenase family protein n=1 Tax=Arsenicicoccus TaxID=267408 RepID=UPI00257C7A03|nr:MULTISPECIES: anthrone oxygenase family protein [Arsenicicoccus]
MSSSLVTAVAGLGSLAVGGLYVAFSWRVMPRLAALPTPVAAATMQDLNRRVERAPFLSAFFGTAALSAAVLWQDRGLAATGSIAYLAGFAMTLAYHVPRNTRLARVDAASPAAGPVWRDYLTEWTRANTVRAALSVGGGIALLVSSATSP